MAPYTRRKYVERVEWVSGKKIPTEQCLEHKDCRPWLVYKEAYSPVAQPMSILQEVYFEQLL